MRPPLVLFVGSVRAGEYETLLEHGHRLGVILDSNRGAALPAGAAFDLVVPHDFSRPPESLAPLLAEIGREHDIVALLNLREFYVRAHTWAAAHLGLPGLPLDAVDHVLNKTRMRRAFVDALGEQATPRFQELATLDDALAFGRRAGYPLILKPSNLYGSLFVRVIHDEAELCQQFEPLVASVRAHSAEHGVVQSLDAVVQAEEYVSGTVHSIDALVDGDACAHLTPVVDVLTGHDVGQAHFGHVLRRGRSALPAARQRAMATLARRAIAALGLRCCAAHVEFIDAPSGPRLLEIAARPGGHRNRVLEMTHGIAFNHEYLRMLLGHAPNLLPHREQPFVIVTPYPRRECRFDGVRRRDAVRALPSFHDDALKVRPGQPIGPARAGFMSSWVIELRHDDARVVDADTRWLVAQPDFFEDVSCAS